MAQLTSLRKAPANWETDPQYVYIGRAGYRLSGYFGNPFAGMSRDESIRMYKTYFLRRVNNEPEFRRAVLALRDKTLVCFCHPLPCHGDVIIEWLNEHCQQHT